MEFFNLVDKPRVERVESLYDQMSIVAFEDPYQEDPGYDVQLVLDKDNRVLRALKTEDVTEDDVVLDLNDVSFGDAPICILTDRLGFLKDYPARMRIAVFGEYFLVVLYEGGIGAWSLEDPIFHYLPRGKYPYPKRFYDEDGIKWYTPDTLPCRPYKNKGYHGFFNLKFDPARWDNMLLGIGLWSGEEAGGRDGIETVMLPEFYEELKLQLPKPIDFCNLTEVERVVRKESPDDPMSVVVFEDDQCSALEDAYHDAVFVLDKDARTLRAVKPRDVTEGDEVFDFNENSEDVPESLQWVLTDKIGLLKNYSARMRLAVFGDYFLVALFDGTMQVHVSVSDEEWDSTLTAPDPDDYDPYEVIDPDNVKWFTPDTLPYAPYKGKGAGCHGFHNLWYKSDGWWQLDNKDVDGGIDVWYTEYRDGSTGEVGEFVINPEFYKNLKKQRRYAKRKREAEACQTVLKRSASIV